jgi:hypothetical protein
MNRKQTIRLVFSTLHGIVIARRMEQTLGCTWQTPDLDAWFSEAHRTCSKEASASFIFQLNHLALAS